MTTFKKHIKKLIEPNLVYHRWQLEAAALGPERITADKHDNTNSYHIGNSTPGTC